LTEGDDSFDGGGVQQSRTSRQHLTRPQM